MSEVADRTLGLTKRRPVPSAAANQTQIDSQSRCVPHLVDAQVAACPDGLAADWGAEKLTYGQWNAKANQLARYLRFLGVAPETPVTVAGTSAEIKRLICVKLDPTNEEETRSALA